MYILIMIHRGLLHIVMTASMTVGTSTQELVLTLMVVETVPDLTEGALVWNKKSCTHEKAVVPLQFEQVIMHIVFIRSMTRLHDNYLLKFSVLKITFMFLVEGLRSEMKSWRLKGKKLAFYYRAKWFITIMLFWLTRSTLFKVTNMYNNIFCMCIFFKEEVHVNDHIIWRKYSSLTHVPTSTRRANGAPAPCFLWL